MNKRLASIFAALIFVLLVLHLQHVQRYLFFFREQMMMFLYDPSIIADRYLGVAGPAQLLSHLMVQFFKLPYLGAIVTGGICTLSAVLLWKSLWRITQSLLLLPLAILPTIFICDGLFDVYYDYVGLVAYFLFSLFLFIDQWLAPRLSDWWRIATTTLLALLLFWMAGAVAMLFAVCVLVIELVPEPRKSWQLLLPILVVAIVGAICVKTSLLAGYRYAFQNGAYYEPILKPTNFYHTPWILTAVLPLLAPLAHFVSGKLRPLWLTVCSLALLVLIGAFAVRSANRNGQKMYPMIAMDHFIVTHNWQGLLNSPYTKSGNFLLMNRLNLALSHEGKLLNNFFDYPQVGPYSILTELKQLSLDVEITTTLSEIFYQMDNIASAMEKAFNTVEGLRYGSPSNMQMLVRTNIIFGAYPLAEKYIRLLEKTLFYKDWASDQRRYLYNDELINNDPEYGAKRKSLPENCEEFTQSRGAYADLLLTIRTNPKATAARDYAIGYLLLANDTPHINAFADEFYGTELMPETPQRLQEAIVAANEKDLDYCRSRGVTEETIQQYQQLKQMVVDARRSNQEIGGLLRPQYGNTYWYYLLVTSPQIAKLIEQSKKQPEASMSAH
jgi:hypothetical protein